MKIYELSIMGDTLTVSVDEHGNGRIETYLSRIACPSCGIPECVHSCDGSQGADENNDESEEDAIERIKHNAALDALESSILAHACAGIKIDDPAYVLGIETALDAIFNNF